MSPKSMDARMAVAENDIEGIKEEFDGMQNALKAILGAVQEIEKKMIGNTRFFAGMCFAYGSMGMIIGGIFTLGFNYFFHTK